MTVRPVSAAVAVSADTTWRALPTFAGREWLYLASPIALELGLNSNTPDLVIAADTVHPSIACPEGVTWYYRSADGIGTGDALLIAAECPITNNAVQATPCVPSLDLSVNWDLSNVVAADCSWGTTDILAEGNGLAGTVDLNGDLVDLYVGGIIGVSAMDFDGAGMTLAKLANQATVSALSLRLSDALTEPTYARVLVQIAFTFTPFGVNLNALHYVALEICRNSANPDTATEYVQGGPRQDGGANQTRFIANGTLTIASTVAPGAYIATFDFDASGVKFGIDAGTVFPAQAYTHQAQGSGFSGFSPPVVIASQVDWLDNVWFRISLSGESGANPNSAYAATVTGVHVYTQGDVA